MNTMLFLDEAWIFSNRLNPAMTLIKESKPTLALALQDICNTKKNKTFNTKKEYATQSKSCESY